MFGEFKQVERISVCAVNFSMLVSFSMQVNLGMWSEFQYVEKISLCEMNFNMWREFQYVE